MHLSGNEYFSYTIDPFDMNEAEKSPIFEAPMQVIGFWLETPDVFGPIVRLYSNLHAEPLISFVRHSALILTPLSVLKKWRDLSVPIPMNDTPQNMKTVLSWVHRIQIDSRLAHGLVLKGCGVNIPLPAPLGVPLTVATMHPGSASEELLALPSVQDFQHHNIAHVELLMRANYFGEIDAGASVLN